MDRRTLASVVLGATALLERAGTVVLLGGPVAHEALGIDAGPRRMKLTPVVHQLLAGRADVEVTIVVIGEVGAAERAVLAGRLVEYRDVRLDALLVRQPGQHGRRTVAGVGDQTLGP